jgi:hypothetical protein
MMIRAFVSIIFTDSIDGSLGGSKAEGNLFGIMEPAPFEKTFSGVNRWIIVPLES